ncbi:MAG: molybdopterin cofactor-binding domain-containing protein [Pseudomonadaceae bacterium]
MSTDEFVPRQLRADTFAARWKPRPDATSKARGEQRYPTDELDWPGLLHGRILRSAHAHARILGLNVKPAQALPGVRAVVTAADIPGANDYGIVFRDQPVFCTDHVRYLGDALAAVAADTPEIAAQALRLIEVQYALLPVVGDAAAALAAGAPQLHPNGNLLDSSCLEHGDVNTAFDACAFVVEGRYSTPRQMHVFMETEGGVVVPDGEGGLTFRVGCQSGHRDREQLASILDLPLEKVRVIGLATGGGFGGKDELTMQPAAGLLALRTGRPVRIHFDRRESTIAGVKRHPVELVARTGCDADGRILAHQLHAVLDTGAYATLGPAVLTNLTDHAAAPLYRIPNVKVTGQLVYTNNSVAGAFRGFGGNQATFVVESQLDKLAKAAGLAPAELRKRNLRKPGDPGVEGQTQQQPCDPQLLLDAALASPLWDTTSQAADPRWLTGTGMALGAQGNGLGNGLPDSGGARLCLSSAGRIELAFGFIEYGQGVIAAVQNLACEYLNCAPEDLDICLGDSSGPDSGPTSASRSSVIAVEALRQLRPQWISALQAIAGADAYDLSPGPGGLCAPDGALHISYTQLAGKACQLPDLKVHFDFPTGPDEVPRGRYLQLLIATVARVAVDRLTGRVRVEQLHHITAGGKVIHPPSYLGQIEGAAVMGMGMALLEDVPMQNGQFQLDNLDAYLIPTLADAPQQRVDVIEGILDGEHYPVRGIGELGIEAICPALAAAIENATAVRPDNLPVRATTLLNAMQEQRA